MLADNGFPLQPVEGPDGEEAPFAENYYCTAVPHKETGTDAKKQARQGI